MRLDVEAAAVGPEKAIVDARDGNGPPDGDAPGEAASESRIGALDRVAVLEHVADAEVLQEEQGRVRAVVELVLEALLALDDLQVASVQA